MLPAERSGTVSLPSEPQEESAGEPKPELTLVPSAADVDEDVPFETGLFRSAAIGAIVGFALIFVMVVVGLLIAGIELWATLLSAVFIASFGGIGFGGMEAASMHKPPTPKRK